MRKPWIFVTMIVLLIIIGVLLAIKLTRDFRVKPTNSKKVENKLETKKENTTFANETIENIEKENVDVENEPKEEQPKTDLEKAIDIVKEDWGEGDTDVYYAEDRKNRQRRIYYMC